jgi:hypothetical protein
MFAFYNDNILSKNKKSFHYNILVHAAEVLDSEWNIQWNLSKLNLHGTILFIQNRTSMGPSYSFRTEPPWDHLIHSEQNLHGTILFIQNRTSMGPSYSFKTEPPWDHLIHSEQNLHGTILFIQNRQVFGLYRLN